MTPLAFNDLESMFRITINGHLSAANTILAWQLQREEVGRAFIKEVGEHLQSPSPVVTASLFAKRYLTLICGALHSMSHHGYGLPIALNNLILYAGDSWKILSFSLIRADGAKALVGDRAEWRKQVVRPIIHENMQPFFHALSSASGISSSVLWSHAAYIIHYYYHRWIREAETPTQQRWLEEDFHYLTQLDGLRVTFREIPHVGIPGEVVRIRKHCCLAYKLPGGECCYTCPLLDEPTRTERIHALGN